MSLLTIEEISDKTKRFPVVDGPFGTQLHADEYVSEGIPVIRITNLSFHGKFIENDLVFITKEKAEELKRSEVVKNDIIIAKTGATIGKSAKYPFEYGIIASSCLKVSPDKKLVNPDYLLYLITSFEGQRRIIDGAIGSTRTTINNGPFKKISFDFPEREEQDYYVKILFKIDTSIEQTEKLISKYQRIKTGMMQDLLAQGIDEKGNIRSRATHKFVLKNGIEVPEEWEVDCLGCYSTLHNNLRKPISALERFNKKGIYPYYGATGIIDFINEFRIDGKHVLIGEDGDHFLKFEKQEMTHLVKGKFNVSNHAHILSGKNGCLTEWIHYFFSHRDITFYLTRQGAGRFKLNKQALNNLPICVPPNHEQKRIIDFIETFDKQFNKEKKYLNKLNSIKIGLMQDLLSGKVRVK